jgi:hypothetical protein
MAAGAVGAGLTAILIANLAVGLVRSPSTPAPLAPDERTGPLALAIVGDSITASAETELADEAAQAGWVLSVEAVPGATTPEMQDAARRLAAGRPSVAVVHLGTNDWICAYQNLVQPGLCRVESYTSAEVDGEITAMATTFERSGACVVGIIPYLDHGLAATWSRLHMEGTVQVVADWRTEAIVRRDEWLIDEMGHLSPDGRVAYARFVAEAARSCQRE